METKVLKTQENTTINTRLNEIYHIREIFDEARRNPDKEVYICYTNSLVKELKLNETIFQNPKTEMHRIEFPYFYISKMPVDGVPNEKRTIGELRAVIRPKIIKTKHTTYSMGYILRVNFLTEEETGEVTVILNDIFEELFYFVRGSMKIAKLESRQSYLIMYETSSLLLRLMDKLSSWEKQDLITYKFFREYKFDRDFKGKVFVPDGYKPYLYNFIYNIKGAVAIIDEDNVIYSNIQNENRFLDSTVEDIQFHDVYNFLDFNIQRKFEKLETKPPKIEIETNLRVVKDVNYNKTLKELKIREEELKKELRFIERKIKDYISFGEYYAGFFIDEEELNDIYYLFILYDKEDLERLKVFKFISKDGAFDIKTYYLIYGPVSIIPSNVYELFIQDPNWSNEYFKVLLPKNHRILPDVSLEKSQLLVEKFIKSGVDDQKLAEEIKNGGHFLIIDQRCKYFNTIGVFVKESSGLALSEFLEKYAKLKLPGLKKKDGNDEDYFMINSAITMQFARYELNITDKVINFYNAILSKVDSEVKKSIEAFDEAMQEIITLKNKYFSHVELFKKDIEDLRIELERYFKDEKVFNSLKTIYNNIKEFHNYIGEAMSDPEIEQITKDRYIKLKNDYHSLITSFENLTKDLESKEIDYHQKLSDINTKFDQIMQKLAELEKDYINSKNKLEDILKQKRS